MCKDSYSAVRFAPERALLQVTQPGGLQLSTGRLATKSDGARVKISTQDWHSNCRHLSTVIRHIAWSLLVDVALLPD